MKKIIAWPITRLFYHIGDFISRSKLIDVAWGYRLYNRFMNWSVDVQDWADLKKPWEHVDNSK